MIFTCAVLVASIFRIAGVIDNISYGLSVVCIMLYWIAEILYRIYKELRRLRK